jgi:RNA ligase
VLETLEKYHREGLLHKQTHPTLDLTIWNYSPKVQYEKLWDEITLQCRGLVTNSDGKIIARPFGKFFNYEEHENINIPNETFDVYEKMDGSLGILFNYRDEWIMATRGSFISEQSIKATEILKKYKYKYLPSDCTYLFEIIYPQNRIVVNYGDDEKLVLLGSIQTNSTLDVVEGYEYNIYNESYEELGFELVKKYDGITDFTVIKKDISDSKEGFVIRFKNGFRMKIKGDEYCRLHHILTNISNRDIWEYLKDGKPLDDILDKVPDEFYDWVKTTVSDLQNKFNLIKIEVEEEFKELINKKEFAEKIKDNPNKSFLFKRLDSYSNQLNEMIWNSIYPTYSKPFKKDE